MKKKKIREEKNERKESQTVTDEDDSRARVPKRKADVMHQDVIIMVVRKGENDARNDQ